MGKSISIKTSVPGPHGTTLLKRREKSVPVGVFQTAPVFAQSAKGALITDVDGNRYIDLAGGIGVVNVGHASDRVIAAVKDQAERFLHTCFHVVMYEPYVALAEKLAKLVPGSHPKKTLLINSGAEAVENAIKIARKYTKRTTVITLENAFHGRTLLAMTLTSKVMPYKEGFGPFAPDVLRIPSAYCYRCAFGLTHPDCGLRCAENLERVIKLDVGTDNVAAFVAEPVQGEGGFVVPPPGYLERISEICNKYGILLIVDEVQTGFGRTGKMLAIEHTDVVPDMVVMAKSLGAGLPISAVAGRSEVMDSVHVGGIGGTYGGNPLACAAALEVIAQMEEGLVARGADLGKRLIDKCKELQLRFPMVGDVRGLGAMVAMELVTDRVTKQPAAQGTSDLMKYCYEHGVILVKAGVLSNIIRFLMPLVITDEQLDEAIGVIHDGLAELSAKASS